MKARIFIVRAFVLAMVLAPSTLWASARHLGVSSCRVEKAHYRASHISRQRGRSLGQLVAAMPRHPFYQQSLRDHVIDLAKIYRALNYPAEAVRLAREDRKSVV